MSNHDKKTLIIVFPIVGVLVVGFFFWIATLPSSVDQNAGELIERNRPEVVMAPILAESLLED